LRPSAKAPQGEKCFGLGNSGPEQTSSPKWAFNP
jgi:hypothetical protein